MDVGSSESLLRVEFVSVERSSVGSFMRHELSATKLWSVEGNGDSSRSRAIVCLRYGWLGCSVSSVGVEVLMLSAYSVVRFHFVLPMAPLPGVLAGCVQYV